MPPWADRRADCLSGMVFGAFVGYFGFHLLCGPVGGAWGLLLGAALGALIGWGRERG